MRDPETSRLDLQIGTISQDFSILLATTDARYGLAEREITDPQVSTVHISEKVTKSNRINCNKQ